MVHAAIVGFIQTPTATEVLIIMVVGLVVLGPERLPGAARSAGQWITKIKAAAENLQADVQDVMDDPAMQPIKDLSSMVAQPKKTISEFVANAESTLTGNDDVPNAPIAARPEPSEPEPTEPEPTEPEQLEPDLSATDDTN